MAEERDPDDILHEMDRILRQIRDGTIERVENDPDELHPIAERHLRIIRRRANSDSTNENEKR